MILTLIKINNYSSMKTITHKLSNESFNINDLPCYSKHYNSMYGYLVLTNDKRILVFLSSFNESVYYEDVTEEYDIS